MVCVESKQHKGAPKVGGSPYIGGVNNLATNCYHHASISMYMAVKQKLIAFCNLLFLFIQIFLFAVKKISTYRHFLFMYFFLYVAVL